MMKKLYDVVNMTLLLLMALLLYSSYPRLPARVPAHFNMAGQPDRWSGRGGLAALFVLPFIMTIVFYIAIKFVPRLGRYPRRLNIPHKE